MWTDRKKLKGEKKKTEHRLTLLSNVESLTLSWMFLSRMFRIFTSLEDENWGFKDG